MSEFIPISYRPQQEDGELLILKRIAAQGVNRSFTSSLASVARTATTSGAPVDVDSSKGIIVFLHVTSASGTGGLHIGILTQPIGWGSQSLAYTPTAITATGRYVLTIYPGAGIFSTPGGRTTSNDYNVRLSPRIVPYIGHDDASSYTYSLDYQLLP